MTTYVLIPGGGGDARDWHLVVPLLETSGHRAVAVDLPSGDPEAGLDAYVAAALDAVASIDTVGTTGSTGGDAVVVVGHSLGGFTAPIVAERLDAEELVFLAAMIPTPGETAGEWWSASGFDSAWGDQEMDDAVHFFHDLPPAVLAEVLDRGEPQQTDRVMEDPFPLPALPAIPTRGIAATDDRFFPLAFMDGLIRDRLGVEPEHVATGHLPALANPTALVDVLLRRSG